MSTFDVWAYPTQNALAHMINMNNPKEPPYEVLELGIAQIVAWARHIKWYAPICNVDRDIRVALHAGIDSCIDRIREQFENIHEAHKLRRDWKPSYRALRFCMYPGNWHVALLAPQSLWGPRLSANGGSWDELWRDWHTRFYMYRALDVMPPISATTNGNTCMQRWLVMFQTMMGYDQWMGWPTPREYRLGTTGTEYWNNYNNINASMPRIPVESCVFSWDTSNGEHNYSMTSPRGYYT